MQKSVKYKWFSCMQGGGSYGGDEIKEVGGKEKGTVLKSLVLGEFESWSVEVRPRQDSSKYFTLSFISNAYTEV